MAEPSKEALEAARVAMRGHEGDWIYESYGRVYVVDKIAVALDAFAQQAELKAGLSHEGHDKPCYYCGEPTNAFAGNPGRWPVALPHADEPGVVKWHHGGCVSRRLVDAQQARGKALDEARLIARKYADAPIGGEAQDTQEAFDLGMVYSTGAVDNAAAIEEAITALKTTASGESE